MKRYGLPCKLFAFLLASLLFLTAIFCSYATISLFSANLYQEYPYSLAQSILYEEGRNLAAATARYYAATTIGECPKELVDDLYGLTYYGGAYVQILQDDEVLYVGGEPLKDGITLAYNNLLIDCPILISAGEEPSDTPDTPDDPTAPPDVTSPDDAQKNDEPTVPDDTLRPINTHYLTIGDQVITYQFRYREIRLHAIVSYPQSKLNNINYKMLSTFFPYRYALIVGLVVSLLLGICLTVYLLWVAGRGRSGQAELIGMSRLPLDVYLVFSALVLYCIRLLFYALVDNIYPFHLLVFNVVGVLFAVPLALGLLYIFSAQCKCKGGYWWRHTVIGRLLAHFVGGIRALFRMLPSIWQWLLICLILILGNILSYIFGFVNGEPIFCMVFLLCAFLSLVTIGYGGYCFGTILIGARKMAHGETGYQLPEKYLFGAFRDCARQLNSLSDAANTAIQSQIRAERMKTELITNVSHDIKTPLTSIINFVDLLEKPHTDEDEAQYLDVLARQSQRLKKLIEDLMELSRANTGNITVNLATLDAVEFANQALGEFSDKLEAAGLTPVFRAPECPLPIVADGRLLWRVLSNLLVNTVKYAAPNTRVYVDLTDTEQHVQLSIRNISRAELNITAEELLERFVRGDVSRNTEGSGLGLNIAKSLTEVQGGTLALTLDGDLFKVTLTFPRP